MWRVLLAGTAVAGCSGSTPSPDAAVVSERFTPVLCTSGTPGDSTCPINNVDLGTSFALHASFVARPVNVMLEISGFQLLGTASHADGVNMEVWCADCYQPLARKLVAASLDVGAMAPTFMLSPYAVPESLTLRIDAIR